MSLCEASTVLSTVGQNFMQAMRCCVLSDNWLRGVPCAKRSMSRRRQPAGSKNSLVRRWCRWRASSPGSPEAEASHRATQDRAAWRASDVEGCAKPARSHGNFPQKPVFSLRPNSKNCLPSSYSLAKSCKSEGARAHSVSAANCIEAEPHDCLRQLGGRRPRTHRHAIQPSGRR